MTMKTSALDETWTNAVEYLEQLGDIRAPSILLSFRRTDDSRRECMRKNGSSLIYYTCDINMRKLPGDPHERLDNSGYVFFKGVKDDACLAIEEAMTEVAVYFNAVHKSGLDDKLVTL